MSSTCTVHDCGQPTQGFMCKGCLAELERALAETQSLRHELSVLATGQAKVYRSSGAGDAEIQQQRHDAAQAALWEAERAAREAPIAPAYRDRADRTALPSTRTMVNLHARDMLTTADTLLVGWARVLHEHTGTDWFPVQPCTVGPTHEPSCDHDECRTACGHPSCIAIARGWTDPVTVERVVVWLTAHAESFRWHEAAADAHHDITDAHRRMQRAVDRGPSRVYAGPCDAHADGGKCTRPLYATVPPRFNAEVDRMLWWAEHPIVCDGYRPLFDRSGSWRPDDKGCGTEHGREDRRTWMLGEIEDRLLPLSLLQDALPELMPELAWPTRSTWWRWARLLEAKTVIEGVEFFRGGDVIDLCMREQQRIRGNAGKRQGRIGA